MGRPFKTQLNYFPLDTGFASDLKVRRLIMKHGAEAVSVYLVLVGNIYASNGYYLEHDDDLYTDIAFVLQLSEEKVKEVIDTCLRIGLFDAGLMEKWRIYTSFGVQARFAVISSRLSMEMDSRFLTARMKRLLTGKGGKDPASAKAPRTTKKEIAATKKRVSATETGVSATTIPPKEKKYKSESENKKKKTKAIQHEESEQKNTTIAGVLGAKPDANARLAELQRLFNAATGEQND